MLDLDDTLFLERDYVRSGFEAVGAWVRDRFSIDNFAAKAYDHFLSGRRGNIFDAVLQECGCTPNDADIRSMVRVYREHTPAISLLPDAKDFLTYFGDRCYLCLITDGPVDSQMRKLAALELHDTFDVVVFTGAWGEQYSKPHRRSFEHVQLTTRVSPRKCVYIGDNPSKDFEAPLALGWRTVRLRREGGLCRDLQCPPGLEPEIEVADLRGLVSILARDASH